MTCGLDMQKGGGFSHQEGWLRSPPGHGEAGGERGRPRTMPAMRRRQRGIVVWACFIGCLAAASGGSGARGSCLPETQLGGKRPLLETAKSLVQGLVKSTSTSGLGKLLSGGGMATQAHGQTDKIDQYGGGASLGGGAGAPLSSYSASAGLGFVPPPVVSVSVSDEVIGPTKGPTGGVGAASGPTVVGMGGPQSHYSSPALEKTSFTPVLDVTDEGYIQQFLAHEVRPAPPVEEGPMAELMRMTQAQERALVRQAAVCRIAVSRMATLQRIILSRPEGELDPALGHEVDSWKARTLDMQTSLTHCLTHHGRAVSDLVEEKAAASYLRQGMGSTGDSSVTPEEVVPEPPKRPFAKKLPSGLHPGPKPVSDPTKAGLPPGGHVEGPSIRSGDGQLKAQDKVKVSSKAADKKKPAAIRPVPAVQHKFEDAVEAKFRVGTYHGCPVYGAVLNEQAGCYDYLGDTELHLVWDVDQSKLVGEGTNDVELVLKCVLWWKEELKHDPGFIPRGVPDDVKAEFMDYCESFDLATAFDSVMHLLLRPGAQEFTRAHPQAKWWTFTNKDREVDGQVVRDVSDDDGMVGKFQTNPHEVSGKQVVDANKYALQVLDEIASKHAGLQNQERPIIGVRGKRKDLGRIVEILQRKRRAAGQDEARPITIVLIDDRFQDAYGNCQANDPRVLCHIPAFNAIQESQKELLIEGMERILPTDTLLKFYSAFRDADKNHALVQCVDIMSDDQSMLIKKKGAPSDPFFEYTPKVLPPGKQVPPLKVFRRLLSK